jgi:hypothetical protein
MSRDDDVVGGEIDTPITFAISRVYEEDTTSGPGGGQFVGILYREVGIENTAKQTQVL